MLIHRTIFILTICCLTTTACLAEEWLSKKFVAELVPEEQTVFLLQVDEAPGKWVDRKQRVTPIVNGGEVIQDEQWGPCLKFGGGEKNGLTIKDDGKLNFNSGLTLDAWVYFEEEPPAKPLPLALKVGSFAWDIGKGKLNTSWLVFPTEPTFTTTATQFKYFPVGGDTINGLMQIPVRRWTRLTMSYDESLGSVTTSINGMVDRQRYRYRGAERLQCDGRSDLTLFAGYQHCRVGAVHLRTGRPRITSPSLEVYVNQLPYQDRVMLTFDHLDPALLLPIEATIVWEKATGEAKTIATVSLDSHSKRDLLLDLPTWKNSLYTIHVHAQSAGKGVFAKSFRVANVQPSGPVKIHEDRTLSHHERKFFPLMVYHAMPDDFPLLAELGFNVLHNDFNLRQHAGKDDAAYQTLLKQSLEAAHDHKLLLLPTANSDYNKLVNLAAAKDSPAALGWYAADEPWGDLTRLTESYNTIKMLEPNLPTLIVQNNYSRLQETAQGADIIATDPYPIPNVSLRAVVDATQAAVRSVSGKKPVWTVLPQYLGKVPTRDELRCMAWLAIIAGADGLGFFDWDERLKNPESQQFSGWYTKEHPEQVENMRVVLKELRALEHLLLASTSKEQPKQESCNAAIHFTLRDSNGKRFLLIANDSRREETAALQFTGVANIETKSIGHAGEASPLRIENNYASLTLPPLGVAIYELDTR